MFQFLLFLLLINNGFLNEITATSVSAANVASPTQENEIKFLDLNTDVQYDILDLLDTENIINVMEAIPDIFLVGISIYKKRYNNLEVNVKRADCTKSVNMDFIVDDKANPSHVIFHTFEIVLNLFKHFGCVIERIHIENRSIKSTDKLLTIARYINKYASESLIQINLCKIEYSVFSQFTLPFERVKSVAFVMDGNPSTRCTNGSLPLNQIFPKLSQLKMQLWADVDYNFINLEFPNLDDLHLIVGRPIWAQMYPIEELFRKNPQIRIIALQNFPMKIEKIIETHLPNVENLTLLTWSIHETVQLQHVKHFCYIIPTDAHPLVTIKKLFFPRLESVKIENLYFNRPNHGVKIVNAWDAFFRQHLNISKLHYIDPNSNCNDLMDLTTDLQNLTEMTLESSLQTSQEKIVKFIENHEKLIKFKISIRYMDTDMNNLLQRLENEWAIEHLRGQWKGYSFERKHIEKEKHSAELEMTEQF